MRDATWIREIGDDEPGPPGKRLNGAREILTRWFVEVEHYRR